MVNPVSRIMVDFQQMKAFAEAPFIIERHNPTGLARDEIGRRIERAARQRGLVVRGAPEMVSVAPPLTITHGQIDDLVERLRLAIGDVLS